MNFFEWVKSLSKPVVTSPKTVEELITAKAASMTESQRAQYWHDLDWTIFGILGKVDVPLFTIPANKWLEAVKAEYPSLSDEKIEDNIFTATTDEAMSKILEHDWTNLIPYVPESWDCDDFAAFAWTRIKYYYHVTALKPVWGTGEKDSHAFNMLVTWADPVWKARLIEPQTDSIFEKTGPLGLYVPNLVVEQMGILNLSLKK